MTNVYTYPEMNKIVKALLKNSDEPMLQYAAARIEELEKAAGEAEKQIKTNADRIRAMTNYELAVYLEGCVCPFAPCPEINVGARTEHCIRCWSKWLEQKIDDRELDS